MFGLQSLEILVKIRDFIQKSCFIRVSPGGDGGRGQNISDHCIHILQGNNLLSEQAALSVTAQTLQFATLLVTPHCLHQASFTHLLYFFWPLKMIEFATGQSFLSSIKDYSVLV